MQWSHQYKITVKLEWVHNAECYLWMDISIFTVPPLLNSKRAKHSLSLSFFFLQNLSPFWISLIKKAAVAREDEITHNGNQCPAIKGRRKYLIWDKSSHQTERQEGCKTVAGIKVGRWAEAKTGSTRKFHKRHKDTTNTCYEWKSGKRVQKAKGKWGSEFH